MADQQVVIQTKLGQLRGLTKQSILTDKTYYAFVGIPYGKPPLGELRFKAPQPFGSWKGIRDALQDGNDPKQPTLIPEIEMNGDEDCLYLNVYINELPEKSHSRKPVLVSIHGGGFIGGSGSSQSVGPDYLMYGDAVVVSFNYRCGAFGFLSLGNEEVPGNAGLKDQTLALKWVHDNIDSFGGDPNNVTIFGISAGGASVSHQLLSPSSRGLFHKAIIQSGFAGNPWAFQENPKKVAINLAKALGCQSEDPDEILKLLRSVSADDIVDATKKISAEKELMKTLTLIFTPCVEVSGAEPFLPDTPENLMKRGEFTKVPVIIGSAVKEGSVAAFFNGVSEEAFQIINNNPEWLVPLCLKLKPGSNEEKEATQAIWDFYFKGKPISWDNVNEYLLCQSDLQFNIAMEQTRTWLVEKSTAPVYTYLFTNHSRCICKQMARVFGEHSSKIITSDTCHGADCMFLYTSTIASFKTHDLTLEEKESVKKLVKTWTVFASTGNPNLEETKETWERDSITNPCFMDIGETWKMKSGLVLPDRTSFWKNLISKYSTQ